MDEQTLQKWLADRMDRIEKHATSIQPGYYPEPIHHMRTETKRLRAMLRLISSHSDQEFKLPKSYRKLYSIAGSIRDPQIHLQELFVTRLPRLPMFAVWLGQCMAPGISKWEKAFQDDALDRLKEFMEELPKLELELPALLDYFKTRRAEIAELLKKDPEDEDLHQIRKYSKDLMYLLAFCEKQWPEAWMILKPMEDVLDWVSDRAGAFNDKRNLLDAIHQFEVDYKDQLEDSDREACEKAIFLWTRKKEQARKRLLVAVRALLSRKIAQG